MIELRWRTTKPFEDSPDCAVRVENVINNHWQVLQMRQAKYSPSPDTIEAAIRNLGRKTEWEDVPLGAE